MTATTIGPASGSGTRRRSRISDRATPARALPLLPAAGLLLVFLAGPIAWALGGSLTNQSLSGPNAANPEFIGLDNFARLFADPVLPLSIGVTVVFVVGSAIIGQNILGLLLAVLFRSGSRAVAGVTGVIVVTAWVLPEIVAAFVSYAFLSADGTLNHLLAAVGITGPNWLYAFPVLAIILANTWRGTAFSMMIYRAALDDVPLEVVESSMLDGAGGWQRLRLITIPMIRGTIFTNLMLTTLQTLSVFTLIWVMTRGGPGNQSSTLPVLAYAEAFQFGDIGYGNAIAVVMLALGAVFSIGYVVSLRRAGDRA
ncbi:carbohydrate ABC transporter permease [Microbacterium invictum]|uniref:Multiple sugar transport system permease protein n=1 Tax=Microbacterium invictum TaxID=515415 RepID=A0AA40SRB2_9MICO|nr:sugar ABC transporter permease [Microbacterium invictum]MBB4140992.1 multiple sugar transport system permease protein [Microbacterium invictum]